jgi:hypothetical protein
MKIGKMLLIMFIVINAGCQNSQKEKELELKEKELELKEQELETKLKEAETKNNLSDATEDVKQFAEAAFKSDLAKLLSKNSDDMIDLQESHTGDFTGDGKEDVAIYYNLVSKGGGNAIRGQGLFLYQNLNGKVNLLAHYQPEYLFTFKSINNGKVYVEKLKYAEEDASCCPSIRTEHAITIANNKAF